ncbi:unnamed protein product [Rotaria socialis]|uniref:Uncharacterized protein n=1 Tax=Rotaria socialis TaxID=392032 RepID=A0A819UUR1_9BILA|nr:unnamed protein product [Rotaria socialis]
MELFYSKLDKHIESLDEKFRSKFVIRQAVYNGIILVLKDGCGKSSFKFWVHKHFKLVKIGELQVVYGIKSNNPVITYEQLYVTIKECHKRVRHHGRDKTWKEVVFGTEICGTKIIVLYLIKIKQQRIQFSGGSLFL